MPSSGTLSHKRPADADRDLTARFSAPTLAATLALLAVAPYLNTLFNQFVYDDLYQVLENPEIRSFRYLKAVFTTPVWSFMGGSRSNYYRPMMTFGYMLCYRVFGFAPYGFHLANVILNAAVVGALFLLTLRMYGRRDLAFLSSAIFALHPVHTEPVAWVAAVTDLELALFSLLTFWFFLEAGHARGGRALAMQAGMAGSFGLALLSKEQAMVLPLLAMIYEQFYRDDRAQTSRAQKVARYRPLWLVAVGYLLLRVHWLGGFAPEKKFHDLSTYPTALSAVALTGKYLGKMLWPARLCGYYVFHPSHSLLDRGVLAALLALLASATVFVYLWQRARPVSFGLLWFFATLAPVLNPHWVGLNVFAERYLYLPSAGLCWIAAWALKRGWRAIPGGSILVRRAAVAALAAISAAAIFRIAVRNRDWQDSEVFYTRTLASEPEATLFRVGLGSLYRIQGNAEASERELRQALEQEPELVPALDELGNTLIQEGRYNEAAGYYRQAMELEPGYAAAHLDLGGDYLRRGMMAEAELQLRAAAALAPWDSRGFVDLGVLHWQQGDRGRARSSFERAVAVNPFDSAAHLALAKLSAEEGRSGEAANEYRSVLALDPDNVDAYAGLRDLGTAGPHPGRSP